MKKIAKIFFVICAILMILGCKKDEDKELKIIELNIYELIDLFDSEEKLIFAILNDNNDNSDKLYKEIENYQKITDNCVYFVDTTNILGIELEYFNILTSEDPLEPRIYVIENGQVVLNKDATITYQELNNELRNTKYTEIDITKFKENRTNNYNKGIESLENGLIGTAYYEIYMAKPKEEAKDKLENENIFNLLNKWEYFHEEKNYCEYLSLQFIKGEDAYYQSSYNGSCSSFAKDELKKTKYSYYLNDNKIMSKKDNQKEYQEAFTINRLDNNYLNITLGNKTYDFELKK